MKVSSVYIHIPFCKDICTYCDFCKFYYNEKYVDEYLIHLSQEIDLRYKNEEIKTLYIGGGTPTCLNLVQLEKLLCLTKKLNLSSECEFTIESNVDLSLDKILLLKKYGVNRVSIGVQTIDDELIKYLNRKHDKNMVSEVICNLNNNGLSNINVDLIYGIEDESMEVLKRDLDFLVSLDIKHISTYSLIIEDNTILKNNGSVLIDEDLNSDMYFYIKKFLDHKGFVNYEFSNFSLDGYESKHNLVYWNNLFYYGFGAGASGYIDNIRYDNTKNLFNYLRGNYVDCENVIDVKTAMENEMILGLRKIEGVSVSLFFKKYGVSLFDVFNIDNLVGDKLIIDGDYIKIDGKYLFVSNDILLYFIDNFKDL